MMQAGLNFGVCGVDKSRDFACTLTTANVELVLGSSVWLLGRSNRAYLPLPTMDASSDDEGPPELVHSGSHVPAAPDAHDIGRKVPITVVTGRHRPSHLPLRVLTLLNYRLPWRGQIHPPQLHPLRSPRQEDRSHPERLVLPHPTCLPRVSDLLSLIFLSYTEFGDSADIEKQITVSQDNTSVSEWVSLANGCICCSVKDSGVNAIEQLMDRRGAFDYILLETTGLADPGNIAPIFWVDDGLGSTVYLDGIVTVIDAYNVMKSLEEPVGEEKVDDHDNAPGHGHGSGPVMTVAHLQISHADIIILNKTDLISPSALQSVTSRVRSINGLAKIINTTHAQVPDLSGILLDLHAYDGRSKIPDFTAHGHSHLDPSVSSACFPLSPFDPEKLYLLENWLQILLWDDGTNRKKKYEIHRLKGYIPITDGSARVVQGVREIFDIMEVEGGKAEGQDEGKIVFIGKGLEHIPLGVGM